MDRARRRAPVIHGLIYGVIFKMMHALTLSGAVARTFNVHPATIHRVIAG